VFGIQINLVKGRIKFSICSARAKLHGLQEVKKYLGTIKTIDPQLKDEIRKEMIWIDKTTKTTLASIHNYEKQMGLERSQDND